MLKPKSTVLAAGSLAGLIAVTTVNPARGQGSSSAGIRTAVTDHSTASISHDFDSLVLPVRSHRSDIELSVNQDTAVPVVKASMEPPMWLAVTGVILRSVIVTARWLLKPRKGDVNLGDKTPYTRLPNGVPRSTLTGAELLSSKGTSSEQSLSFIGQDLGLRMPAVARFGNIDLRLLGTEECRGLRPPSGIGVTFEIKDPLDRLLDW